MEYSTVFLCLVVLSGDVLGWKSYKGDKVIRVTPRNHEQLVYLENFVLGGENQGVDFWTEPLGLGLAVDMRIPNGSDVEVMTELRKYDFSPDVIINDVGSIIEKQMQTSRRRRRDNEFSFSQYHTYDEIMSWIDTYVAGCPSDLDCTAVTLGQSWEGRDLRLVQLGVSRRNKRRMFFDCGMHAREWISPATCVYLLNAFAESYREGNADTVNLLRKWDLHVLPVMNPDGYVHSWTSERLWRKTRTPNRRSRCKGTDPNRNWGFQWIARHEPCSIEYPGPEPFSDPITQAVSEYMEYMKTINPFHVYVNVHSYHEMWLPAWGYTPVRPDDYHQLERAARAAVNTTVAIFGREYEIGTSAELLAAKGGLAKDWAKGVGGIKYTYTLELRDKGHYGFLLPEDQIIPTGIETFFGFIALLEEVDKIEGPRSSR